MGAPEFTAGFRWREYLGTMSGIDLYSSASQTNLVRDYRGAGSLTKVEPMRGTDKGAGLLGRAIPELVASVWKLS